MSKEKSTHLILIFVFIFFLGINSVYFFINLYTSFSDNIYAFNELFINYQAGFIRRGLLGEVAWQLNNFYSIDPKTFFSLFFFSNLFVSNNFIFFYYSKVFSLKINFFYNNIFTFNTSISYLFT